VRSNCLSCNNRSNRLYYSTTPFLIRVLFRLDRGGVGNLVKRWIPGWLLFLLFLLSGPAVRAEEQPVRVTLDGVEIQLDVPGEIREGRTLVPFRPILEALGAEVSWDPAKQTVSAKRGIDTVVMTVGSPVVEWRLSLIQVDVAPVIVNGRTLVPLRFLAQAMGLHVRWDEEARTVHLETQPEDRVLGQGIRLVHEKSCMVCHTINGAGGHVGPVLNGVTDRHDEAWLHTWLRDPQAVREGTRMPNFHFTEDEISAVVEYLKTLK
jgi:cytochrome c2